MFAPTSPLVVVLLLAGAAGLLWVVVRARPWGKVAAGLGVLLLGMSVGIVAVNDSFGYYTTWTDAYSGTFGGGSVGSTGAPTVDTRRRGLANQHGHLIALKLGGKTSKIRRSGFIYLPPQYYVARYRKVRFPVVELLHGTPGGPWNWRNQMHIATTIDTLMAHRTIGPMVFVMPQLSVGPAQECLNYGSVHDDTYIANDVPADVRRHFRVSRAPAEWAMLGYSSGGYCAANLALRHRGAFGAAASMDGYYWPTDGPAATRLGHDPKAEVANDPVSIARHLPDAAVPMPQFWLSAGTGSKDDLHSARTFAAALRHLERVSLVLQPGANHNFYSWRDQVPRALAWVWQAIAPPSLRFEFPIGGSATTTAVPADPRAVKHKRPSPTSTSSPSIPSSAASSHPLR